MASGRRDGRGRRDDTRTDGLPLTDRFRQTHGEAIPVAEIAHRRDADAQQLLGVSLHVGEQRLVVLLLERGDRIRSRVETEMDVGVDQTGQDGPGRVGESGLIWPGMALDFFARADAGDDAVPYENSPVGNDLLVGSGQDVGGGDEHAEAPFLRWGSSVGGAQGVGQGEEFLDVGLAAALSRYDSQGRSRRGLGRSVQVGVNGVAKPLCGQVM